MGRHGCEADGIGMALTVTVAVGIFVGSFGLLVLNACGLVGNAGSILVVFAGTLAGGFAVTRLERVPETRW